MSKNKSKPNVKNTLPGNAGKLVGFSLKIAKKSLRKMHKYGFFPNISNANVYLVMFIEFRLSPASKNVFTGSLA